MTLIQYSVPPVEFEPPPPAMQCEVCANMQQEWIAFRAGLLLCVVCHDCVAVLFKADAEMHRQWNRYREWREELQP